jgi:hypothetical protein
LKSPPLQREAGFFSSWALSPFLFLKNSKGDISLDNLPITKIGFRGAAWW